MPLKELNGVNVTIVQDEAEEQSLEHVFILTKKS